MVFNYSTSLFPFQELVIRILETGGEQLQRPIARMHLSGKGREHLLDKSGARIQYYQSLWNKDRQLDDIERGEEFMAFDRVYQGFIKNVVGPGLGGGRIIYQRAPTLRVYIPGDTTAMGKFHTDEEYHHQPSEINFWFPISDRVHGSNSLWVESKPNEGDFAPLDLSYGQCWRGYLNQCRHGCNPNTSGDTRVSIDFRAVSESTGGHDPSFHQGIRRGPKAKYQNKFDIGGFYSEMILPLTDCVTKARPLSPSEALLSNKVYTDYME